MISIRSHVRFRLPDLPRVEGIQTPYKNWPAERAEKLRELWADGASVNTIARELGISRNAVTGKAARLGLPRRESPIQCG